MKNSRRNVLVFCSLVGTLSLTSVLLLALFPGPLARDSSDKLMALDQAPTLEEFLGQTASSGQHWNAIFIHHSRTSGGDARTLSEAPTDLSDHFVIGNGDGCDDGGIQAGSAWQQQEPASIPGVKMDRNCISICVVGDLDQTAPTSAQARKLAQLVRALQRQFHIPAKNLLLVDQPGTLASSGRHFPIAYLRQQVLP